MKVTKVWTSNEARMIKGVWFPAILMGGLTLAVAAPAMAEEAPAAAPATTVTETNPAPAPVAPATPPPPYSLPWQLRPAAVGNVVRAETALAFYEDAAGNSGQTSATMLLGTYKVTPTLAPLVRLGLVQNAAPGATPSGTSFVNPIVGLTYAKPMGALKVAGFAGGTIPIGMGGGDSPDPGAAAANAAGIAARSAMDNAMFAVDYFTAIVGGDVAYVANKFTVQAEVTLLQLLRVRGEGTGPGADGARTNSTYGIHAGYFLAPFVSLGAELRYQRWLTHPNSLVMGTKTPIPDANMDTVTMAIGPRFVVKVAGTTMRPGIAYVRGLDKPLSSLSYNTVQIDLPVAF
jgi:hypothetical protein